MITGRRSVSLLCIPTWPEDYLCLTCFPTPSTAKEYRSVGEGLLVMNVTVFYVDEAEDIMCFMVDYPDKDEASRLDVVSEAMVVALQKYANLCTLPYRQY